jgi:hypothetical protein
MMLSYTPLPLKYFLFLKKPTRGSPPPFIYFISIQIINFQSSKFEEVILKRNELSYAVNVHIQSVSLTKETSVYCQITLNSPSEREKVGIEGTRYKSQIIMGTEIQFDYKVLFFIYILLS